MKNKELRSALNAEELVLRLQHSFFILIKLLKKSQMIKPKICSNLQKFLMIILGAWKEKLKMKCNKICLKHKNLRHLKIILRH
jgi:hypothetical protein